MKRPTVKTVFHLCEVLEWAKGNRGLKEGRNPYGIPEVEAALKHLANLQGIKDWLDARTAPTNPQQEAP